MTTEQNSKKAKKMNLYAVLVSIILIVPTLVVAVVPSYFLPKGQLTRLEYIKAYFDAGFMCFEIILMLLVRQRIKLSLRQLKRILARNGLRRRFAAEQRSPFRQIAEAISQETESSGECVGYRAMWRRLVKDYGLNVRRQDVLAVMHKVDPESVTLRRAHRLKRRLYYAKGPNYCWHMDGYDKLKPFGFCIHGCIDGYTRRILWLEVGSTNNDPKVVAQYYMDALKELKCAPRILRADNGTENTTVAFLQTLFRYHSRDSMAGLRSFMYGKSTSNQRIEAWWGILRRQGVHWWINVFKDLKDCALFDSSDPVHIECLRFCFMDVLQAALECTRDKGTKEVH